MNTSSNMLVAAAVAACGLAVTAATASAVYSIGPPATPFTGTNLNNQTFRFGATGPTLNCPTATFTGQTAAASSPSADFLAAFSGSGSGGSCPAGALGNYAIAVHGGWTVTVTGGGPSPAPYAAEVKIPAGSYVTLKPLVAPPCTVTISDLGNSALSGVGLVNVSPVGIRMYGVVSGITYTASTGCPGIMAGTRSGAVYDTGGTSVSGGISTPGIVVAGP